MKPYNNNLSARRNPPADLTKTISTFKRRLINLLKIFFRCCLVTWEAALNIWKKLYCKFNHVARGEVSSMERNFRMKKE